MLIPSEQDFAQAVALWREWNGRINVISRKDEDNIFAHHILPLGRRLPRHRAVSGVILPLRDGQRARQ